MKEQTPLRRLQLVEFDLLCRLADVCEANRLRYYLLGGTLLGAVRHGGFIPWDDDIDVALPRPDYEKLLELARKDACLFTKDGEDETVRLTSLDDDRSFRHGMAKLSSSAVQVINRSANDDRYEEAWIDIIPLDGFPDGLLPATAHKARLLWWKVMDATAEFDYAVDVKRDRGFAGNMALKFLSALCHTVRPYGDDYHAVLMKMNAALKRYGYDDQRKAINLFAAIGFREIFERRDFGEGRKVAFEGRSFNAPENTEKILTIIYGPDYLTPPPEGQRDWHHTEVLAWG